MRLLWILLMLVSARSFAQDAQPSVQASRYHLLDVEYLDMTYQKFKDIRDPYVPNDTLAYRISTNYRLSLMRVLYWDNQLHMEAAPSGTPTTVGWHWIVGIRLTDGIDIFDEHHSRHVMEEYRATNDGHNVFPVEDSFGIKFKFIEDHNDNNKTIGGFLFK